MTSTLLSNGKQQFIDINGAPLVAGTVAFYVQGTLTPKDTYQDSGQTITNTNPVVLDSRGQAIIWGNGVYRQIVKDSLGNVIWDQLTASNFSGTFGSQQTVASNTTCDIGAASSNNILVSGTTTITSFGTSASLSNPLYVVQFGSAALTLTYNGTSLILPGGLNIITQANDQAIFEITNAVSGYWRCVGYWRANGQPITMTGAETSIVSSTTTDLGSITSNLIKITGTTTITSMGSSASTGNPIYFVRFGGSFTLTYNATSLILPDNRDLSVDTNDFGIFEYLGSGNWLLANFFDHSGVEPLVSGALLKVDSYTTHGTSTWTKPAGCNSIIVEVTGAGGGGAGAGSASNNHFMASGGGGAGAYSRGRITTVSGTYTVTVGQGGAAGSAGANNGSDGTASSFGAAVVCNPGTKGIAGYDATASGDGGSAGGGGNGGTVGTAGNILAIHGAVGGYGFASVSGTGNTAGVVVGGTGGIGPYGGAAGSTASYSKGTGVGGNAGTGPGSGGSGAASWSAGAANDTAGGAGADGCIIVYSYS